MIWVMEKRILRVIINWAPNKKKNIYNLENLVIYLDNLLRKNQINNEILHITIQKVMNHINQKNYMIRQIKNKIIFFYTEDHLNLRSQIRILNGYDIGSYICQFLSQQQCSLFLQKLFQMYVFLMNIRVCGNHF